MSRDLDAPRLVTHDGNLEVLHTQLCPVPELLDLAGLLPESKGLGSHRAMLVSVAAGILDSDGDDQFPEYSCHFCGAVAGPVEEEEDAPPPAP